MNIVHKEGSIQKNADGLRRCPLENIPDNPACAPLETEPQIPIEGINITYVGTEFFEKVRHSYKQDKNFHILTVFLDKDCNDTAFINSPDEVWKSSYYEVRFHLFYGINHTAKNSCVMQL
ncbi:hypothetical protein O181_053418 [Austropuccinia psidii MF-1]|uniref:Uncharacterized protein n=1 Tax=Austropuccinia psidii MF-1 TaxID=1389203 RepID=A0A9Q3E7C0_9BASI|nr:hypothetical protein [Austropuccinia psidii MF-1]